ncbi:MAG: PDZ domain-containing protein, partial [Planctomycetes bacterium]|nr:PDZ domain-containing protein [Planctomycetota bacterium]
MPDQTANTNRLKIRNPHSVFISILILIFLVAPLPAHLDARPLTPNLIDPSLMLADNHIKNHQWIDAEKNLKNAQAIHQKNRPADPPDPRITQRLDWCFANISLEKRYEDQSLARLTQRTDSQHALNQLTQVVHLIDRKFYLPLEKNKLVKKALAQLIAAAENPIVQNHYNLNVEKLPSLKQSIQSIRRGKSLSQPIQTRHIIDIAKTLKRLTEDAGFPPAFAAVELAYAYTKSLDKYSYMLTPKHYSSYSKRLNGRYSGIGIDLVTTDSYPMVFDVVTDSPASRSGILPGDFIIKADGYNLQHIPFYKISRYLNPANQTYVKITIKRDHRFKTHTLTHKPIHAPS